MLSVLPQSVPVSTYGSRPYFFRTRVASGRLQESEPIIFEIVLEVKSKILAIEISGPRSALFLIKKGLYLVGVNSNILNTQITF